MRFVSALQEKSCTLGPPLPDISAEIHLAVRKQLLFIDGGGWRNLNFKDVLNELPRRDGLALGNLPPAPLHASAEGSNYNPPELLLLAPCWYSSCMCVVWISFFFSSTTCFRAPSVLCHCARCHLLKAHRHHSERPGSGGCYYSCIGLSVASHLPLKWIWSWLMSYLAPTDRWLDQHLPRCVVCPAFTCTAAVKDPVHHIIVAWAKMKGVDGIQRLSV